VVLIGVGSSAIVPLDRGSVTAGASVLGGLVTSKTANLKFSEIKKFVPRHVTGVYEIHTVRGVALKVGISTNLRRRLRHHGESLQSGLTFKAAKSAPHPREVTSHRSILAKHLYFDRSIAPRYDLRSEAGRQEFLEKNCRIRIKFTSSGAAARRIEKQQERSGRFRYRGRVMER